MQMFFCHKLQFFKVHQLSEFLGFFFISVNPTNLYIQLIIKQIIGIIQSATVFVFLRQNDVFYRKLPVNGKCRIVPGYSAFAFGYVILVAFVLKNDFRAHHHKSVSKTTRNEHLTFVLIAEYGCYILSESGRTFANIDRYIEHTALNHTHQLGLCVRRFLEMKSPQHSVSGFGLVVLHKLCFAHFFFEFPLLKDSKKITPVITKYVGREYFHVFYFCIYNFHKFNSPLTPWRGTRERFSMFSKSGNTFVKSNYF